jgi:glyoxylase-like metal-dependent hydrolase (beta-lactamase superfamily II)
VAQAAGEVATVLLTHHHADHSEAAREFAEAREATWIWPGHGPVVEDALGALDFYRAHRRERLAQVESALGQLQGATRPEGSADDWAEGELPRRVVEIVYADVDPVLWGAAELSVRANWPT